MHHELKVSTLFLTPMSKGNGLQYQIQAISPLSLDYFVLVKKVGDVLSEGSYTEYLWSLKRMLRIVQPSLVLAAAVTCALSLPEWQQGCVEAEGIQASELPSLGLSDSCLCQEAVTEEGIQRLAG